MLEELNIMKLNFEVKHRFDFSGTLIIWIELLFKPIANSRPSIDQQALILRLVRK